MADFNDINVIGLTGRSARTRHSLRKENHAEGTAGFLLPGLEPSSGRMDGQFRKPGWRGCKAHAPSG
jgi:hypothetical protein